MARYTEAVCRMCRREGQKLFLKGDRCYSTKCAMEKRSYAPGQHGQGRSKASDYALQLREKQKTKRFYGLQEAQFRNLFEKADRKAGITGENLLQLLELRLDNVVYRLGLAKTRRMARQIIVHGHIKVNGKKVDIPSYQVKAGDVITLRERSAEQAMFKALREGTGVVTPKWLTFDAATLVGTVAALPAREDIDCPIQEHLIVELYSR
jgi:small subunit ribosomal protein S4